MDEVALTVTPDELPADVAAFLREADRRAQEIVRQRPNHRRGFIPCDAVSVYHALQAIRKEHLACGDLFCEWGSGLGIVASLAAMLGFEAYGIELDGELFDAAEQLVADFDVPIEFVHGSFVPEGADRIIDVAYAENEGELMLDTRVDRAYDDLGLEIEDFDIIFAFPWPNDERLTSQLFKEFAADGALLMTYNETESVRLWRK